MRRLGFNLVNMVALSHGGLANVVKMEIHRSHEQMDASSSGFRCSIISPRHRREAGSGKRGLLPTNTCTRLAPAYHALQC